MANIMRPAWLEAVVEKHPIDRSKRRRNKNHKYYRMITRKKCEKGHSILKVGSVDLKVQHYPKMFKHFGIHFKQKTYYDKLFWDSGWLPDPFYSYESPNIPNKIIHCYILPQVYAIAATLNYIEFAGLNYRNIDECYMYLEALHDFNDRAVLTCKRKISKKNQMAQDVY